MKKFLRSRKRLTDDSTGMIEWIMAEGGESRKTPLGAVQDSLRRFLTKQPTEKGQVGKAPIAPLTGEGSTPLQDNRDRAQEVPSAGEKKDSE